MPRLRHTRNRHTPPRRALPAEPDRRDCSIDLHTAPQVTSVALLALTHAIAAVIGWCSATFWPARRVAARPSSWASPVLHVAFADDIGGDAADATSRAPSRTAIRRCVRCSLSITGIPP
jgi:hypothetical protein